MAGFDALCRCFFFVEAGVLSLPLDSLFFLAFDLFPVVLVKRRFFVVLGVERKLSERENLPAGVAKGEKKESSVD